MTLPLVLQNGGISVWTPEGVTRRSRAEFWALVQQYRTVLETDPRIGDFNLIVARTSVDMMALFAAHIAAGRCVSFFPPGSSRQDPAYYLEQQREAIKAIQPDSILVIESEGAEALAASDGDLARLVVTVANESPRRDEVLAERGQRAFRAALANPEKILFWQHSSGTTGIKKAVGVTAGMLNAQYSTYWPSVERIVGAGDVRIASWLPLYHDMGLLATFLLPLLSGADVSFLDPFDWVEQPDLFFRMIADERSTICWMPNFAFRHFSRLSALMPAVDLSSMRAWISCSEPVRYPDALAFEQAYASRGVASGSVVGCYAMAETVFAVSQLSPGERRILSVPSPLRPGQAVHEQNLRHEGMDRVGSGEQLIMSSGPPLEGVEVQTFVIGAQCESASIYGEIGLRGTSVFSGYRNKTAEESSIRPDGFYMTGDLGVVLDGHVFVFGRTKEIIIVNGKNIYAGDVEDHVSGIAGIRPGRVVAFGLDNERTGTEDLIVVAERRTDSDVEQNELARMINSSVASAFLVAPFDVRVVDERWLVKSTSGKISRQSNRSKYLIELERDSE